MKVLVTGGAGYVGSHAVKELEKKGYEVLTLDNFSRGHRWAVKGRRFVEGDLGDEGRLREIFSTRGIGAVCHFAALAYVGESVTEPQRYYENNVGNSLRLLKAMLEHDVRIFIFSSSCAVYGDPREIPMTEEHPLAPVNPYGMGKFMVERILADYDRAHGLRYASLRYFNAAGADPEGELGEDHDPETHLIPRLLQAALGRIERVEIFGKDYPTQDGTCVRDYVHVTDLAAAHILALEALLNGGASDCFNLGTGRGYSVMEVVQKARAITRRKIPTVVSSRRPGDPPVLVASHEKAKKGLGWRPAYQDLGEIISSAWKWHRKRC